MPLRRDCTFRSRLRFTDRGRLRDGKRLDIPLRRGTLRVHTRFDGNPYLLPGNALVHTIRAG